MNKLFSRFVLMSLAMLMVCWTFAQTRTVTGVVTDAAGEKLPGVTVALKGTSTQVITDASGNFKIDVSGAKPVLVFSYVGKSAKEVEVRSGTIYPVTLVDDAKTMDAVVVTTGYMTQRKADLTGAISLVSRDDYSKTPAANVMKSLQGKVPGLTINSDGNPAENVGIQVRGITSLNGSSPLIVLDGQPVSINLRDINPNDIESMQVLKDAASASIYGSRAASGVILINTRKGKRGDAKVTYEGYVGVSKTQGIPDMLSSEDYGRAIWQATVNDGDNPDAIQIYSYDWGVDHNGIPVLNSVTPRPWLNAAETMPSSNTNWFDEGNRIGLQQNHQVTITGGSERLTSLLSLNYYKNEGTQVTSFFRRIAARFNNEYQIAKGKLTIGENLTITNLRMRDVNNTYGFLVMPPNIPVYANDGQWGGVAMPLGMDDYNNPVRQLEINKNNVPNFMKVLGTAYANLKILPNLALRTQYGVDYSMWYERVVDSKWEEAGGKSNTINGVRQNNYHDLGQTWTNTLTYNFEMGKHRADVLVGTEAYKFVNEGYNVFRSDVLLEDRDYAYLGTTTGDRREFGGGGNERTLFSYFGKINYAFDSKYLLGLTLRRDGASVFGANNRYGTFPAVSAGWRISDEKFMNPLGWISELKLRGSYGVNGNSEPLSAGRLVNIYVPDVNGTSYPIAGNPSGTIPSGYRRDHIGNADLKWESTTQLNFGLDFGLLNNRLRGSFDWYNKKTSDILFEPPYIAALGEGGYRAVNGADVSNKGFELIMSWSESKGDFSYTVTANAAAYRNKIVSLPENIRYNYGGNGLLDDGLGRPLFSHYGLVADGIFKTQEEVDNSAQQPGKGLGRIRYKDLDGDGIINEIYDRTWLGSANPDFTAGLNLEARYKNFDITVFFQGVFGNEIYNSWKEMSDFWNISVQNDRNHPARIKDAWSPSNPNSTIPALSRRDANGEKRMSSYYIENGSFIKMRTIDLGYTLPRQLIEKWKMSQCRFYISAQNLFTIRKSWGDDQFTGLDPEMREARANDGFRYPYPLTALFGVNVTF